MLFLLQPDLCLETLLRTTYHLLISITVQTHRVRTMSSYDAGRIVAGFVHAMPVKGHMTGDGTCGLSLRDKSTFTCVTRRRRTFRPRSDRRLPTWRNCTVNKSESESGSRSEVVELKKSGSNAQFEHGLVLGRDVILTHTRNGRSARLRRWATLSELDMEDTNGERFVSGSKDGDRRVDVWLVVQRVQKNYRLLGRARTVLPRACDRCTALFEEECDGRFELFLIEDNSAAEVSDVIDKAEAVESFGKGVDGADLTDHVRDAVLLGLPSRALCKQDCAGIIAEHDSNSSNTDSAGPHREQHMKHNLKIM